MCVSHAGKRLPVTLAVLKLKEVGAEWLNILPLWEVRVAPRLKPAIVILITVYRALGSSVSCSCPFIPSRKTGFFEILFPPARL